MQRKSLRDTLPAGGQDMLSQAWETTQAAADFTPLPKGEYVCRITAGTLQNSKNKGTPAYKIEFTVSEGPYAGRKIWHDCWLTGAALPHTKRDLSKLGVTSLTQLERPLPAVFVCRVKVALRTDDDGTERNKVQGFEVIRTEKPPVDPYAPKTAPAADGTPPTLPPSTGTASGDPGDGEEPAGEGDTSFNPESF